MRLSFLSAAVLAVSASALPVELEKRQAATTCGSTYYSASQVRAAVSQGYEYYASDQQVGSNDYPHTYSNWEGFGGCISRLSIGTNGAASSGCCDDC